jgi:hypothetical protein
MKNTNKLYERLKNKGNIAFRACKILNESGKKNKLGRDYNIRYVYNLAKKPGVDSQVDIAIVEACRQYLDEIEKSQTEIQALESEVLERAEALFA